MRRALAGIVCVLFVSTAGVAAAKVTIPAFRSPSGNISCLYQPMAPQYVSCEIKQASYKAALTHHCGSAPYYVDWTGFSIGLKNKGTVDCAGGPSYDPDHQRPHYVTLPYGKKWRQGVFSCDSETAGVTCTNTATGHSIFVSRQSYRAS
jgi:hypothetical protein